MVGARRPAAKMLARARGACTAGTSARSGSAAGEDDDFTRACRASLAEAKAAACERDALEHALALSREMSQTRASTADFGLGLPEEEGWFTKGAAAPDDEEDAELAAALEASRIDAESSRCAPLASQSDAPCRADAAQALRPARHSWGPPAVAAADDEDDAGLAAALEASRTQAETQAKFQARSDQDLRMAIIASLVPPMPSAASVPSASPMERVPADEWREQEDLRMAIFASRTPPIPLGVPSASTASGYSARMQQERSKKERQREAEDDLRGTVTARRKQRQDVQEEEHDERDGELKMAIMASLATCRPAAGSFRVGTDNRRSNWMPAEERAESEQHLREQAWRAGGDAEFDAVLQASRASAEKHDELRALLDQDLQMAMVASLGDAGGTCAASFASAAADSCEAVREIAKEAPGMQTHEEPGREDVMESTAELKLEAWVPADQEDCEGTQKTADAEGQLGREAEAAAHRPLAEAGSIPASHEHEACAEDDGSVEVAACPVDMAEVHPSAAASNKREEVASVAFPLRRQMCGPLGYTLTDSDGEPEEPDDGSSAADELDQWWLEDEVAVSIDRPCGSSESQESNRVTARGDEAHGAVAAGGDAQRSRALSDELLQEEDGWAVLEWSPC